jgi:ABC-type multidrug transport system fused ATPase/permease subunit
MKNAIKNNLFLYGYIKKYAFAYIPLIFLSALFQALSSILSVLGIKYVVDAVEQKNFTYSIFVILIYFAINLLVKSYFHWTNYSFPLLSKKVSNGMTLERMSASQKLDFQCYDIPEYYDAYSRALRSGEQQVSTLVGSSIGIISNIATLVSISSIIASYSWWFLLLAIAETIVSYFVIVKQNKLTYDFNHDNTRINREEGYFKNVCFSSSVQMEDRLFNVIDFMKEKYHNVATELFGIQKKHLKKYNSIGFLQVATSTVLLAVSMLVSTILINKGQLTLGEFVASISGVQSLAAQLLSLVIQFPKLIQNARYADDYKKIVDYTPCIEKKDGNNNEQDSTFLSSTTNNNYIIEFKDVSFKYPASDNWVLRHLSFTIDSNKRVAIVGENGAGKTTIIKLLLRLYDPTEGEILLNGKNLKEIPVATLRSCFTSIFQNYNLYCVSLQENIWFDSHEKQTIELLKKVGLNDRFNSSSDLNRMVSRQFDDNGIVLSGGEAQRLCIARALSKNAPIMLLDEPSAALDPIMENQIINILMNESTNRSMIIITHRLSMCVLTDEIFYVENGQILESGSHDDLIRKEGKYFNLFNTQAKNYIKKEG